jgi:hypothetical protein
MLDAEPFVADELMLNARLNEERVSENAIRLFPNPSSGQFIVEPNLISDSENIIIEIYTLLGERIMIIQSPVARQYQLDLSGYQPGIYLIRVMHGDQVGFEKLIKQ